MFQKEYSTLRTKWKTKFWKILHQKLNSHASHQRRPCQWNFAIDFQLDFPGKFWKEASQFLFKIVLPVILKEIRSIFLISTLHLLHKLSHNYRIVFAFNVYSCSYSFPSKYYNKKRFPIYLKMENSWFRKRKTQRRVFERHDLLTHR